MDRQYSPLDRLIAGADEALRTVFSPAASPARETPGRDLDETLDDPEDRRHVAGLMRVNHAGEVAAQGLYRGQAATARLEQVRAAMDEAAREETDHLAWCEDRLQQLGSRPSVLNPLWYAGSYLIGAGAGLIGDRWSLGFVAETERQVARHLNEHIARLPPEDMRSRAILDQMRDDELRHRETALDAGGAKLPAPVRGVMSLVSLAMTRGAYWI
ncbi:MAG: 2-polyprenyl-3-methyl-6-methoxy-1,4-benzoquinone monooxygenase [Gammaproteobacteria bacterium]